MRINNNFQQTNLNTPLKQNQRTPNFKGIDQVVVGTMDLIDKGGLFASFVLSDLMGSAPRPIVALFRKEENPEGNGKLNTGLALKELTREIITGPSMFIIPGIMLAGAKKAVGKSINVPIQYIKEFGNTFKQSIPAVGDMASKTNLKKSFIGNMFEQVLSNSKGISRQEAAEEAGKLAEEFIGISGTKKEAKTALNELVNKFNAINKSNALVSDVNLSTVNIGTAEKPVKMSIRTLLNHLSDYTDDVVDKTMKSTKNAGNFKQSAADFIEKFTDKRIIQRFGLNALMIACIAGFLTQVPKIYNAANKKTKNTEIADTNSNDVITSKPEDQKKGKV